MFVAMTGILVALGSVIGYIFNYMWIGFYIMMALSLVICFCSYFFSKKMALTANKVRIVTEAEEPRLYRTVQKLAMKANLPMPQVGVADQNMPNAFATGRNPKDAAVVATRPLLDMLTDEELEGVLAHEMSHVKNRDILVMSVASAMAVIISYVTRMGVWTAIFSNNRENPGALAIAILADLTLPFAAMLVQLGVSRNREYLADESAGRLTGKPMALASALERLETGCSSRYNKYDNPSCANMWISDPYGRGRDSFVTTLFRTHPTTADRVEKLKELDYELNGVRHVY